MGRGGIIGKEPEHDGLKPWRVIGYTIIKDIGTKEMWSALVHGIGEGTAIEGGIVLPASPALNGSGYSRCEITVGVCFNGSSVR